MKTPQIRMDTGLQDAIIRYENAARMALKQDNYPEQGPFLVADKIEPLAFEAWYLKQLQKWKLFYDEQQKQIWLYGDPTLPHARTASWLSSEIYAILRELGGKTASQAIHTDGDTLRYLPRGRKEPDFSFSPVNINSGPSVIGEIAYGNESLVKLKDEQQMWCESLHTQFFIGIKIVDDATHHHRDPKCVLITWDRDKRKKLNQIDFGYRTKCDDLNKMFLEIPIKHLYFGNEIPNSLIGHTHVKIDLFELRSQIKNAIISYRNN